jgi:predicted short-subunit dehydrogenase-like oxidoreductase (DUF2520 family)
LFTKKSEIVFIGAGKVAYTLVPILIKKNYSVKGIVSKSLQSAARLGKKYKLGFCSDDFKRIPLYSGIFFITVPDDQISKVTKRLSLLRLNFKECLFVHTSGPESSAALIDVQKKGGVTASFHIMQTFPSRKQTEIRNSYAAIETKNGNAGKFLFSLARSLGLKSFGLTEDEKVFYHMSGVFAANFLNANFFSSEKLLNRIRVPRREPLYLLAPIVSTTFSNIKNNGVLKSLSGPVQRGDFNTIKKHLTALKKLKGTEKKLLLYSYISQSLILLELIKSKEKKLSARQRELRKMLQAELKKAKLP